MSHYKNSSGIPGSFDTSYDKPEFSELKDLAPCLYYNYWVPSVKDLNESVAEMNHDKPKGERSDPYLDTNSNHNPLYLEMELKHYNLNDDFLP